MKGAAQHGSSRGSSMVAPWGGEPPLGMRDVSMKSYGVVTYANDVLRLCRKYGPWTGGHEIADFSKLFQITFPAEALSTYGVVYMRAKSFQVRNRQRNRQRNTQQQQHSSSNNIKTTTTTTEKTRIVNCNTSVLLSQCSTSAVPCINNHRHPPSAAGAAAAIQNHNNNNIPPSMTTPSSVWVQLYWKDEDKGTEEPAGDPIKIKPVPDYVADLKKIIKENDLKEELQHTGITQINVYSPKTCANNRGRYKAGKPLTQLIDGMKDATPPTSDEHPLIVGAPQQQPQQQRPQQPARNTILAWERGSDGSPTELPGEIAAPFSGSVVSSMSTSTRGHIQKVFQTAVLVRDKQQCVVSRKRYKQGSGNVEAAHIIPVAEGKDAARDAAQKASGLFSLYDTCNGISLEKGLHNAFDSYLWCVDEKGIFHLSDAERDAAKIEEYGLAKWAGNALNLNIGFGPGYPAEQILKARYELFLAKVGNKKPKGWKKASKKKTTR